jgi:nitrogen regulatory protein PII
MGRERLTPMTRVEVVVAGEDAVAVQDLFTAAAATGFTTVSNVSGLGHGGYHEGRLLFNDVDSLTLLFTVVPASRADDLIDAVVALLEERPGVMFVSETMVSRPGYFGSDGADGSE